MAEGWFTVDPNGALSAATGIHDAGGAIASVYRRFNVTLSTTGEARPWGSDELGQACQHHYDAIAPPLLAAWPQLAEYVESVGAQVVSAVQAAVAADQSAAAQLGGD